MPLIIGILFIAAGIAVTPYFSMTTGFVALITGALPVNSLLRIISPFGQRNTRIPGATFNHAGIDLGRDIDEPETWVLAIAPGEIVQSYWNDYRGWVVVINHGTFQTLSQHLKEKGPAPGTKLTAGQKIGFMGNSGNPKKLKVAVHLHFELHVEGPPSIPGLIFRISQRRSLI